MLVTLGSTTNPRSITVKDSLGGSATITATLVKPDTDPAAPVQVERLSSVSPVVEVSGPQIRGGGDHQAPHDRG
jgi:hypothetical protein